MSCVIADMAQKLAAPPYLSGVHEGVNTDNDESSSLKKSEESRCSEVGVWAGVEAMNGDESQDASEEKDKEDMEGQFEKDPAVEWLLELYDSFSSANIFITIWG